MRAFCIILILLIFPEFIYCQRDSTYRSIESALVMPDSVYILNLSGIKIDHTKRTLSFGKNGNGISTVSHEIGNLRNLEILILSSNNIDSLPKEIGNLIHLKYLNLSSNKLKYLPEEIQNLHNLKKIDLMDNEFFVFPLVLTKIESLKEIYFQSNYIKSIPKEIENLKNLEIITFYSNFDLENIPIEFGNLTKLIDLNFCVCKVNRKTLRKLKKMLPNCEVCSNRRF